MKPKSIFWGVFFILAAVFVIISGLGVFAGGGIGLWTVLVSAILLAIVIKSIPARNFGGILVPLAIAYKLYEVPLALPHISWWLVIAAAVLMSIGLQIIFRQKPGYNWDYSSNEWGTPKDEWRGDAAKAEAGHKGHDHDRDFVVLDDDTVLSSVPQYMHAEHGGDDNHPYASVKLGAASKYIYGTAVETGYFKCNLGALEVYFDSAHLHPDGADIFIDASLAGVSLYIPRGWRVKPEVNVVLGGVEDHPRGSAALPPDAPELRIRGNLSLGGLELKYV